MKRYAEAVAKKINEEHAELNAEVIEVVKMNDDVNIGVRVQEEGACSGSVHYISAFFEFGVSADECAKEIAESALVKRNIELVNAAEKDEITWDEVKNDIVMRLVNVEYNERFLSDKVHKDLDNGFAIMFDIVKGDYRMAITNDCAKSLGCDETMLVCAAQTSDEQKPVLYDLAEKLMSSEPTNYLEEGKTTNSGMLVLTTKGASCGASAIYVVGTGEKIKEAVGDYYLLPSSIHEWIVVPESAGISIEELSDTVKGANETVVERHELLSYGVYKWAENAVARIA